MWWLWFVVSLALTFNLASPERQMMIGGLFDDSSEAKILEIAFRAAIDKVNNVTNLLPETKLVPLIEYIHKDDSFYASQRVCSMVHKGVVAMFGPQSETTASHVQSMCDVFEIPHIETRWDYRFVRDEYSVNVHPYPPALASIYVKLIEKLDWQGDICILYQDDAGLVRVQELLKMARKDKVVVVFQLSDDHNHRRTLRHVMFKGLKKVIIDCNIDILYEVLKQAQQVGMMTEAYNFFITNLDLQTIDIEDFRYSGANITGFRLVDTTRSDVQVILMEWIYNNMQLAGQRDFKKGLEEEQDEEDDQENTAIWQKIKHNIIPTEAALMYDAVLLFATALTNLDRSHSIHAQSLHCNSSSRWTHGSSIMNYIKHVELHNKTMTGFVSLNKEDGFRNLFMLDVVHVTPIGIDKIGSWHKKPGVDQYGIELNWAPFPDDDFGKNATKIPHYRVATKLGAPYFMQKKDATVLTGNNRYEGYVVELVTELSKILNFTFTIYRAPKDGYGGYKDGKWDGMVGEVVYDRADMALADLTITNERQTAVDFTTPFISLGISILFTKPMKEPPALFSFFDPFSFEVWIYMAGAYVGVSVILFILARFSPYEWNNPYPCIQDPDELENNFTFLNSLWFTIGSLMQQGSDIAPTAVSTRIVAGMWWFFTLIIVSSYTANLAAFLTVEPIAQSIESVHDLPQQTKIKYGCLTSGSTRRFFDNANSEPYLTIRDYLNANPDVLMTNNTEGKKRVMGGNYAFFMESSTIEYESKQECGLREVGSKLDTKGYGIAVKKGSPLRTKLTDAILYLQEKEKLGAIKKTWWEKGARTCLETSDSSASALSLANVGGVFVVLLAGMGFACIVALLEFLWNIRNTVKENRGSLCSEITNELKFVMQCHGSTKPARKAPEPDNPLLNLNLRGYSGLNSRDT